MKYQPMDYADEPTPRERRERLAGDVIWFLVWIACTAPFLSLFYFEATR